MANEIVKYHHELNTIPLRKFTSVEKFILLYGSVAKFK